MKRSTSRRVPKELLLPPRRAPGARNGALIFILGNTPGLIGPNRGVQRTPEATRARCLGWATQRSQPSGHPTNSIWAAY